MPSAVILPGVNMTSSPAGVIVRNSSVAAQAVTAATLTQIAGSALPVPQGGLKVGTKFKWKFNMTKTAAGTASSQFDIAVGLLGTVADTARVSFTKSAGTAAADEAWVEVTAAVRSVSATGVIFGNFLMSHNLAATGHLQIPQQSVKTVSSGFDNRGEGLIVSLQVTTGASDAITIDQVESELQRPA